MEKEYNLPEKDNDNKAEEPAVAYNRVLSDKEVDGLVLCDPTRPGVFTDEEKLNRIDKSIQELNAGIYLTHEDVLEKFKDRL